MVISDALTVLHQWSWRWCSRNLRLHESAEVEHETTQLQQQISRCLLPQTHRILHIRHHARFPDYNSGQQKPWAVVSVGTTSIKYILKNFEQFLVLIFYLRNLPSCIFLDLALSELQFNNFGARANSVTEIYCRLKKVSNKNKIVINKTYTYTAVRSPDGFSLYLQESLHFRISSDRLWHWPISAHK